ncbi:MAG: hypothetical protein RR889_04760 [Akkermansia sp.]
MIKSLILLLAVASLSLAQDAASAVRAARELTGAVKTGDMTWMAEKMYPQLKATLATSVGGIEQLKAQFRKAGEMMKKEGFVCESFETFEAFGEYNVKNKTEKIVIIPTRMVCSILQGQQKMKMEQKGFLYAVAKKSAPETWYFIQGSTSLNSLRDLFYDLPANIPLPEVSRKALP